MFHYTACGLSNVYLENGYQEHSDKHGKSFSIDNLKGLHKAIGFAVAGSRAALTPDEFRFLRTEMHLSRGSLADTLGVAAVTIKKWENSDNPINRSSDMLLRAMFREYHDEVVRIRDIIHRINTSERKMGEMTFKKTAGRWQKDCA